MNSNDIPPEQFAAVLGELVEKICKFLEDFPPIGMAAECHQMRRAKQIKHGEAVLDDVPLDNAIMMFKQIEDILADSHTSFEKVEIDKRRMNGATLRLVSVSTSKKSGVERG